MSDLNPGDIAIVGYNADNPDAFAFLLLVDVDAATEVKFTDNGVFDSGGFRATEGTFTWTAPSAGLNAGTVVVVDDGVATAGTLSGTGPLFSASGDSITVYQGDEASPSFIYQFNNNGSAGGFSSDSTSSTTTALAPGLIAGVTAFGLSEIDNAVYTGPVAGTRDDLLAAIADSANWTGSNSERQNLTTLGSFAVASPAPVLINEVLVSTTGSDVEFIELYGEPGTSLAGLSIVNIESDDASGNIDNRFDLPSDAVIGDNGFYLIGNSLVQGALGVTPNVEIPTNFFENSSSTIALLETASITGSSVDGTETVVDAIALSDTTPGTFYYDAPVLGPDGSFYPSAAGRAPEGGDWALIDAFSPAGENSTPTAGTSSQSLVINEVLVSTAGSDVEFIELYGEPGTSLAGLSIVNIESDDASGNIDNRFDLPSDAVIGDNGFYLIGNSLVQGALGVTPNVEIPTNFFENSSSTIALLETASITGGNVDGTETAVDAVALSDTTPGTFYYDAPVLGPDGSFYPSAAGRAPEGGDWALIDAFSPAGENSTPTAGTGQNGGSPSDPTLISAIQGAGTSSPLVDNVVTVEAIVVGDFQDGAAGAHGDFNGFYLQEEDVDADGNVLTSEGLFVFDGNAPAVDVQIGDKVQVTGTVSEFFGETQLANLTSVVVVSSGNDLPTAATIEFPVADVVTNSDGARIADLEAYEGMRVTVPQEMTVSDLFTLGRFGDMGLNATGVVESYTQANTPSVSGFNDFIDEQVKNTLILDDGSTTQNPAAIPFEIAGAPGNIDGQWDAADALGVGDTVANLTGVIRYSRGSGGSGDEIYRLNPTVDPAFVDSNPREATAPEVDGSITVASFNVLNFFTSLGDEGLSSGPNGLSPRGADNVLEFERQVEKLLAAFVEIDADVYGLIELENEFGDQNGDGQSAIQFLVEKINTVFENETGTPGQYAWVDPGTGFVGGDAIAVGLIYDTNTVSLAAGTTAAILTDADLAGLGVDPGNPVFEGEGTSRSPLAATFEENASGETFTVAVNHFKSKGSVSPFGDNEGIGDGAGNNNEARLQAATALDAWLKSDPTGSGDGDFLVIGDLNAYAMEDPVQHLLSVGYQDQIERFLEEDEAPFSFGFPVDLDVAPQAQTFGALDYILANGALADQVVDAAQWQINSREASALDYNTNFKPPEQVDDLYEATPFRSSDHDPLIVGLELGDPAPQRTLIEGTAGRDIVNLVGTGADEVIAPGAGSYDRMSGGGGEDIFFFGNELSNGLRERDVIEDFDHQTDLLLLGVGDLDDLTFRNTSTGVYVRHDADFDTLYVLGEGLTKDNVQIAFGDSYDPFI